MRLTLTARTSVHTPASEAGRRIASKSAILTVMVGTPLRSHRFRSAERPLMPHYLPKNTGTKAPLAVRNALLHKAKPNTAATV